jgi:hypothetical protein
MNVIDFLLASSSTQDATGPTSSRWICVPNVLGEFEINLCNLLPFDNPEIGGHRLLAQTMTKWPLSENVAGLIKELLGFLF